MYGYLVLIIGNKKRLSSIDHSESITPYERVDKLLPDFITRSPYLLINTIFRFFVRLCKMIVLVSKFQKGN